MFRTAFGRRFFVLLAAVNSFVLGCGSADPPVAQTPPPPVTVSQPVVREVTDFDSYEGRIAAIPTVEVRARVRGHLIKINFQDGQIVKKDDLLFEIDPRPYKAELDGAEAQKASAEASQKLAQATIERDTRLAATGALSRQDLDVSMGKLATSQADVRKADAAVERAKLDLDYTKITAPITGKISRAQVDVGNLVNAGGGDTLLTTINSVDPMYVYFDVDERALLRYLRNPPKDNDKPVDGRVRALKELKIPVEVGLEGEGGYPHKGLLDFADNRVNPSTGTIQVRGVMPNPKGILNVGMRARVRVPVREPYKAVMVTERAIGNEQGRKFVYVVNDKDRVERRDVTLDRVVEGMQVIGNGLKPEDWVIVNGIQRVRDGMTVDPQRAPMPGAPETSEPAKKRSKN